MLYSNLINMQGLNSSGLKQISSFKSEKSFLQEVQSISEVEQNVFKGLKKSASRTFSVNIQPSDHLGEYLKGKTSKNDAEFLVKINNLSENKPLAICKKNQSVSVIDDKMEQSLNSGDKIAYESASQLLQLASLFNPGDKVIVNGSHIEKIFNISHEVQKKPLAKSIVIENEKNDKNQTVLTIKPVIDNKKNKTVDDEALLSQLGNNLPVHRERVEISDSDLRLLFQLANQITSDKNGSIQLSKLAETVCLSDSQNNESKLFGESKLVDNLITKVGDVFKGKSDSKELGVMIKTMVGVVNRIYELQSQPKLAGLSLTYKEDDILIARKIVSSNPVSLVEQSRKGDESGESLSAAFKKISNLKSTQNQDVESIIEKIYQDVNSPSSSNTEYKTPLENLFLSQKKAQPNIAKDKNVILQPGIADNIMRNGKEFYYFPENKKVTSVDISAKRNEIPGLNSSHNDLLPESKINNVRYLIRDEAEFRRISKKTISQLLKTEENRADAADNREPEGKVVEDLTDKQKPYLSVKLDSTLVNVYTKEKKDQPIIEVLKQDVKHSASQNKLSDNEKIVDSHNKIVTDTGVDLITSSNVDATEPAKQQHFSSLNNRPVSKKKNSESMPQTLPLAKQKTVIDEGGIKLSEPFRKSKPELFSDKKVNKSDSSSQAPANASKSDNSFLTKEVLVKSAGNARDYVVGYSDNRTITSSKSNQLFVNDNIIKQTKATPSIKEKSELVNLFKSENASRSVSKADNDEKISPIKNHNTLLVDGKNSDDFVSNFRPNLSERLGIVEKTTVLNNERKSEPVKLSSIFKPELFSDKKVSNSTNSSQIPVNTSKPNNSFLAKESSVKSAGNISNNVVESYGNRTSMSIKSKQMFSNDNIVNQPKAMPVVKEKSESVNLFKNENVSKSVSKTDANEKINLVENESSVLVKGIKNSLKQKAVPDNLVINDEVIQPPKIETAKNRTVEVLIKEPTSSPLFSDQVTASLPDKKKDRTSEVNPIYKNIRLLSKEPRPTDEKIVMNLTKPFEPLDIISPKAINLSSESKYNKLTDIQKPSFVNHKVKQDAVESAIINRNSSTEVTPDLVSSNKQKNEPVNSESINYSKSVISSKVADNKTSDNKSTDLKLMNKDEPINHSAKHKNIVDVKQNNSFDVSIVESQHDNLSKNSSDTKLKDSHTIAEQIDEYINLKKMDYGNKLSMEKKSDFSNVRNSFTVIEVNDNALNSKPSNSPALIFEQKSSGTDDLSILQKKLTYALTRSIMDIVDNNDERNRIVLQIKPDSMGNIRIDVLNKDKVLDIRFECSDSLTQKMVESEKDKLKEVIHDKGFQVSSLFVSDNQDSKENTAHENRHEDSRQHQNESSEDHEQKKDPNKEKQGKNGSRDNAFQFSFSFVNLLEDSNYLSKDLIGTL